MSAERDIFSGRDRRRGRFALGWLAALALVLVLTACPATTTAPSASASATEAPTEAPTAEPTEDGTGSGLPEQQLLSHIPAALRAGCEPAVGVASMVDAIATVSCEPVEGADSIVYGLYDDEDAMYEVFMSWPSDVTLEELEAGSCEDDPPSFSTYSNTGGVGPSGAILCFPAGEPFADRAELAWTDDQLLIRAEARRDDGDLAALYDWWASGAPGPVPAEPGGAGSGGNGGGTGEIPFPTVEEEDLLTHIPERFRGTCVRPEGSLSPGDPGRDPDIVAIVVCFPGDGPSEAGFTQYATNAAMDEAFDQVVEFFELSAGECSESDRAHGTYSIGDEPAGRVLCSPQALGETGTVMHWTDERLAIKAYAASDDPDLASLYEWWTGDSGPIE